MKKIRKYLALLAVSVCLLSLLAFTAMAAARTLTLPASTTTIGTQAFYGDTSLRVVELPEGVEKINSEAFAYSSITEINLPDSLTYIAKSAFKGCSDLELVVAPFDSYAFDWAMENGYITNVLDLEASSDAYEPIVELSWAPVAGAGGYLVYYSTDPDTEYLDVYSVVDAPDTSVTIEGLDYSTCYYFWVSWYSDRYDGESPLSDRVYVFTVEEEVDVPSTPRNIEAIPSDTYNSVTVSWDAVDSADGFTVFYSSEFEDGEIRLEYNDTSVTIEDLLYGTEYCFFVQSFNQAGESDLSDVAFATTALNEDFIPAVPIGINGFTIDDEPGFIFTWESVPYASGYNVYCSETIDDDSFYLVETDDLNECYVVITDLAYDTGYYFAVSAYNGNGESAMSDCIYTHTIEEPASESTVVTGLEAIADEYEPSVTLSWDHVPGADGYFIYVSNDPDEDTFEPCTFVEEPATSVTLDNLSYASGYYFRVTWYTDSSFSNSSLSDYVYAYTVDDLLEAPPTPVNIQAIASDSDNSIMVSWDYIQSAEGFTVYLTSEYTSRTEDIYGDSPTGLRISDLDYGTEYSIRVQAYNDAGKSDFSEAVLVSTIKGLSSFPEAPTDVTVYRFEDEPSALITWTRPDNAEGYYVYFSDTPDYDSFYLLMDVDGSECEAKITDLAYDTLYYFRVSAYNEDGESPLSDYDYVYTIEEPVTELSAPSFVYADASTTDLEIEVYWDLVDGAEQYNIYMSTSTDEDSFEYVRTTDDPLVAILFDANDLEYATTYYFKVAAQSSIYGAGEMSDYVCATTIDDQEEDIVQVSGGFSESSATITQGEYTTISFFGEVENSTIAQVRIEWTHPGESDIDFVFDSETYGKKASFSHSLRLDAREDRPLYTPGLYTLYLYIRPATADSLGDPVAVMSVIVVPAKSTVKVPSRPTNIDATASATTASIDVSWNAVSGATGYNVYYSTNKASSSFSLYESVGSNVTSITATGLEYNMHYSFKVSAINSAGESTLSSIASATTIETPIVIPSAPSGITATASTSAASITLSWNAVSGVNGYKIYQCVNAFTDVYSLYTTVGPEATSKSVTNLEYSTGYRFKVSAYNDAGESTLSGYAYAKTMNEPVTKPSIPSGVTASASSSSPTITVTWNPVSGATGYKVYYSSTTTASSFTLYKSVSSSVTSVNVIGLSYGTRYNFKVSAYNSAGESSLSGYKYAKTIDAEETKEAVRFSIAHGSTTILPVGSASGSASMSSTAGKNAVYTLTINSNSNWTVSLSDETWVTPSAKSSPSGQSSLVLTLGSVMDGKSYNTTLTFNVNGETYRLYVSLVKPAIVEKQYITFDYYFSDGVKWTGSGFIAASDEKPTSTVLEGPIYDQTRYTLDAGTVIDIPFATNSGAVMVTAKLRYYNSSTGLWYTYQTSNGKELASSAKNLTLQNGEKRGYVSITLPEDIASGTYMFEMWSKNAADEAVSARVKVRVVNKSQRLVASTYSEAASMVLTSTYVQSGKIRYIPQNLSTKSYWVNNDYDFSTWTKEYKDSNGKVTGHDEYYLNMCTRAVYSMALSYIGLDYIPVYMSSITKSRAIDAPYDSVSNLIGVTRVSGTLDTLMKNYAEKSNYTPIYLYYDHGATNHCVLVVGWDGQSTYYAVDPAWGKTVTLVIENGKIISHSGTSRHNGSPILSYYQWKK